MSNSENSRTTVDLNGNKIANEITKLSKNTQQNSSETVTNEKDKEIPKEIPKKDIYLRKRDRKLLII